MNFNKDFVTRDKILAPYFTEKAFGGGICHFQNLPLEVLKKLVKLKFADPEETQNDSPSIAEFINFMQHISESYPNPETLITAHGFAVSQNRSDYCISVEGLEITSSDNLALGEFSDFGIGAKADECDVNQVCGRIWWD